NIDKEANANFKTGFHLLRFLNNVNLPWTELNLKDSTSKDWILLKAHIQKALDAKAEEYAEELVRNKVIERASPKASFKYIGVRGMFPTKATSKNLDGSRLYETVDEAVRAFYYNDFFMRTQT